MNENDETVFYEEKHHTAYSTLPLALQYGMIYSQNSTVLYFTVPGYDTVVLQYTVKSYFVQAQKVVHALCSQPGTHTLLQNPRQQGLPNPVGGF